MDTEFSWGDYIDLSKVNKEQYLFKNDMNLPNEIPDVIKQDMEIFREVDKLVLDNKENTEFIKQLERFRNFKPGFLVNKRIIYTDTNVFKRFPILKYSSLARTDNTMMENRFLLPIRLPNGNIYTYMGYSTGTINRYIMPKVKDVPMYNYSNQSSLFGNMESIRKDEIDVYFAEGFFDVYRIESELNKPAVAMLGSKLTRNKERMLRTLKEKEKKRFIYVPDFDENKAGFDEHLLTSDLWDEIYNFNKQPENTSGEEYKDIDQYYRMTRKYY